MVQDFLLWNYASLYLEENLFYPYFIKSF